MSSLRNSVQLIGHLGADPEVKTLESGAKTVRIRMATAENYKAASGEWKEETQWHSITAWANVAERMEKVLHKGSFVLVEGKLTYREFVDAGGTKKYFTEIRANSFVLLDKKQTEQSIAAPSIEEGEGLPF